MINLKIYKCSDKQVFNKYFENDEKFNTEIEIQSTVVITAGKLQNINERIFLYNFLYDFNINFNNYQYFEIMNEMQYFYLQKSKFELFISIIEIVDEVDIKLDIIDLDKIYMKNENNN
jgi:hypothetical protein